MRIIHEGGYQLFIRSHTLIFLDIVFKKKIGNDVSSGKQVSFCLYSRNVEMKAGLVTGNLDRLLLFGTVSVSALKKTTRWMNTNKLCAVFPSNIISAQ